MSIRGFLDSDKVFVCVSILPPERLNSYLL